VRPGFSGDNAGHRSLRNSVKQQRNAYGFARFFMRITKMILVLNETSRKLKNEEKKIQNQKLKNTIQAKLNKTSKPESF
jgi:hypothetical protein